MKLRRLKIFIQVFHNKSVNVENEVQRVQGSLECVVCVAAKKASQNVGLFPRIIKLWFT